MTGITQRPPTTTWPTPTTSRSRPRAQPRRTRPASPAYDNGNQPVTVQRQYSDGTADPTQTTGYDGLGRVTSQTVGRPDPGLHATSAPVAHPPRRPRPRRIPQGFPGEPLNLSTTVALGGQQTSSDRGSNPAPGRSQGTKLTYDPAGRIATSTDPDGRTTQIQPKRRRDGRHSHHSVGHRRDRYLRPHHRSTDQRDRATPSGAAVTTTYHYVPSGQPGAGHVHTISDGTNTVTLAYDADGQSYPGHTPTAPRRPRSTPTPGCSSPPQT